MLFYDKGWEPNSFQKRLKMKIIKEEKIEDQNYIFPSFYELEDKMYIF